MGVLADWQIERDIKIDPFVKEQVKDGVISYGLTSYGYDARVGRKFKVFTPTFSTVVDPKKFDERAFVDIDLTPNQESHNPNNDDCAWNDPETFMHPASRGLPCSCPAKEVSNYVLIPPNSFALGETVETFTIPRDCLAVCVGKSTYARCGIVINVTPLEPEWSGKVTVEISNTSALPAQVYAGEGIMQVIFLRTDGHYEAVLNAVRRLVDHYRQAYAHRICREWGNDLKYIEQALHQELPGGTCRTSYADRKGRYQDQSGVTLPFVEKP